MYIDLDTVEYNEQLEMEFEWLNDQGQYTTDDQGVAPSPTLTTSGYSQVLTTSGGSSHWSWTIVDSPSPWQNPLEEIIKVLRQLQDRLLVIEEKNDDYFKDKAALKKAYDKFRMLEALYGEKKDE